MSKKGKVRKIPTDRWISFNIKMQKGHLSVNVLGTSFELEADQKNEYLQSLYGYYLSVLEKAKATAGVEDPLKIAILAGLSLSDEVFRARSDGSDAEAEPDAFLAMERSTMKMIAKIDDVIHDGK